MLPPEEPFYEGSKQGEAGYGFCAARQPQGISYLGETAAITLAVPKQPKLDSGEALVF